LNALQGQHQVHRAYKKYLNSPEGAKDTTSDERAEQIKEIRQMEVELTSWLREARASMRQ
jgi:hypothetical protein